MFDIKLKDILKAEKFLRGKINKTPLLSSDFINQSLEQKIYFKPEIFQKNGSFKIRGILNKLNSLNRSQIKRGIVTMSVGDHALTLASVALSRRVPCVVVMPKWASQNKIQTIKALGAKVILKESNLWSECLNIHEKQGHAPIHPFDDPLIIAGHGTIGLEILRELPNVEIVLVPVGGGGLISGVAAAIKMKNPRVKIIGVEPRGAAAMFHSVIKGRVIRLKNLRTIANNLAARSVSEDTLACVKKYVDDLILVSDKEIINAFQVLLEKAKMLTEPAGAVAFAALLGKKLHPAKNSKIVCVLSGGNISKRELISLLKI